MKITLRYFAFLRDEMRRGEAVCEVPEGSSCRAVVLRLQEEFPHLAAVFQASAAAVNGEYAASETRLEAGDELAILPPVSGG